MKEGKKSFQLLLYFSFHFLEMIENPMDFYSFLDLILFTCTTLSAEQLCLARCLKTPAG